MNHSLSLSATKPKRARRLSRRLWLSRSIALTGTALAHARSSLTALTAHRSPLTYSLTHAYARTQTMRSHSF